MEIDTKNKGITLMALAITIIVMLILLGVTFIVLKDKIVDKAADASAKTTEAYLQERIGIAWADCKMAYQMEENVENKEEYFKTKFLENLQEIEELKNINISINLEGNSKVSFSYKNQEYTFMISSEGKINLLCSLYGNVKVGDYIEYPIEYDDIHLDNYHYTAQNGWRVLDDGKTSGVVKIISTGVPGRWYYKWQDDYESNTEAVEELINHFENIEIFNDKDSNNKVKGSAYKVDSLADKVTTLTLNDLNYAYNVLNGTHRDANDITNLDKVNDLFINDSRVFYWLATPNNNDAGKIYYITDGQILDENYYKTGIRPVIYLKPDLAVTLNSNIWKIIN